ncbi:MAG TPA: CHAT domain-containing protein [Longimicrobium sp.]
MLDDLARAAPERTVGPRLSVSARYRPCSYVIPPDGVVPVPHCVAETRSSTAVPPVARLWARARKDVHSADALHTAGLLNLLWPSSGGTATDEAISILQGAADAGDRSSQTHGDISAAYLIRASRTQNTRDLLEAITSAEHALEADPESAVARFNLALALDWLGLEGQAREAWAQYLALDSTSGWAVEARTRMRALAVDDAPPAPPGPAASAAEIDAYTARAPQEARLHGWDHLLAQWGAAVLAGDTGRAEAHLRQAQAIGDGLARRGGDATLADAVSTIRGRSGDHAATRALARAHLEYAAGQRAYYSVQYKAALEHFAHVLKIRPPSEPLQSWALVFYAAMLAQHGQPVKAEGLLRPFMQTDTLRYPALAGRSRWVHGTILLRLGRYEAALNAAEDGGRLLGRIGEHEHQGGAQYVAADAQFFLGATLAAHGAAHRALATLRRRRSSIWLLNTLAVAARTAEADGLTAAALRLQNERAGIAEQLDPRRSDKPIRIAEVRLGRARMLATAGMLADARADIEASQPLVANARDSTSRSWLEADLRMSRAGYFAALDPKRAATNLDSVLASATNPVRQLRARVGRAEVRLALGQIAGATADLDSASRLLTRERDAIARSELRASLMEAARGVFDRLTMLRLAAGDTTGALEYLERGRTSFGSIGPDTAGTARGGWRIRPGEVAVAYALIGDTLLAWTVAGTSVRMTRQTVNRASLIETIEALRLSLERREEGTVVRRPLAELHRRLIAPLESRLGGETTTLVIVADGELAAVPFSALYDARHDRYLVQAHALRYAGSLRDASGSRVRQHARDAGTLLVADPAFDGRAHPGLARLPGARREADSIAATYPRHAFLSDTAADAGAVEAALARAAVVHFAGHAVFDDQRPERSYLVLAPEHGQGRRNSLTAAELGKLRLGHVDLVVLSACQTLGSRNTRSGGFAGFAGALLDGGAGGVLGSLWRVDDELTTPLMIEFHRAYHLSGDGPSALREAQLRLLRASDPALRSPAAWAGFRYAGD